VLADAATLTVGGRFGTALGFMVTVASKRWAVSPLVATYTVFPAPAG
jgi:hypothetical protein